MSVTDTISQAAATNPLVGVVVATQSTKSAILAGLQTGDGATVSLLSAVSGRALETSQLLASLIPNLGQNVNTAA